MADTSRVEALSLAPDSILYNGKVVTVDGRGTVVQAVAVKEGRVLAVGSTGEMRKLAGEGTRQLDMGGRRVIPGIYDSHNHMLWTGVQALNVDLGGARSIHDVLETIAERVRVTPPGQWVVASGGWHESRLRENRFPLRTELDAIAPSHPVYIPRGGHNVIVNSKAFELAKITGETPNPSGGGVYVKDRATGELTGHIIGAPAWGPIAALIPPRPEEELVTILRETTRRYNAVGITSVIDPGLEPHEMRAYQRAAETGALTVRTNMMWKLEPRTLSPDEVVRRLTLWGVRTGFGDNLVRIAGIKMWLDGGVETGFMKEDYARVDDPAHPRGIPSFSTEALSDAALAAARLGWQVGVHCVGDAAVESFLAAMEAVNSRERLAGRRFTMIHGMLSTPDQLRRLKALDIVFTAQQPLNYALTGGFLRYWGKERAARSIPFRWILDAGLVVGGGSDSFVAPFNPFLGIWSMVTRETAAGGVQGPEHRTTREEALSIYTTGSASMAFEEKVKGSIEVGKLADLVILERDILTVPESEIKDVTVWKTMLGGRFVYEAA